MSNENQKDNKEVSIKPFITLFLISIGIFAIIYFLHSKNIENRFNNTLQNYEKSMSAIFNNMAITNGNNENINTNSFQTNNEIRFNNNIENLKLSFEVGFKMLESSMNEIMKNSNDILQFWFAFLSIIMIVFTIIGFFLNNNILNQSKEQFEIVKIKAGEESRKLIKELENNYNQTIEKFKEKTEKENNELIEKIKIKANEETERLIQGLEDKYNNAIKDIDKIGKEEGRKIEEESNKYMQESNLFNLGFQAYNNKDYQLAIYYFTEVIKLNPNYSIIYYSRGLIKYYLKDYEVAIEDYNKAIELNPNSFEAYNNRGLAKCDLANTKEKNSGEYNKLINEAIEDCNKAIELNNNYLIAFYNRGLAKSYLANTKEKNSEEYNKLINEAIKDYNKAIELNNNYSYAYFNRGLMQLQLGKIEEAIKDFIKAYELDNNGAKEKSKRQLIKFAKNGDKLAIKFCKEHNINYRDKDNKE